MNEIVVIGSSSIDLIMKMDRLPEKGETVSNGDLYRIYGGKGANQAVAASRSGGDVAFIACVGDDPNAKPMVENYKDAGINTEYIFREAGISTGTAVIMNARSGDNYYAVSPGANYRLTPAYLDTAEELIINAEVILLQYEILPETLAYAINKAKEHKVKIIWNFAPARKFDELLLPLTDILIVNEIEAGFLANKELKSEEDMRSTAEFILARGVETVIITLGPAGSYVATKDNKFRIPSFDVRPVDNTAVGDAYCGCLATALTEGKDIKDAVSFATAAAALSVTKMGAQPSVPSRKEIDDFLNELS